MPASLRQASLITLTQLVWSSCWDSGPSLFRIWSPAVVRYSVSTVKPPVLIHRRTTSSAVTVKMNSPEKGA
eukprot:9499646-Pyramimonas_sp.AAC.1